MSSIRVAGLVGLVIALVSLWSLPSPASAVPWAPGPFAEGPSTVDGVIDLPGEGSTVPAGQSFTVAGWVVDTTAEGWAGIDEIHLYDGRAGEGGLFLGKGLVALPRPDVGAAWGNPHLAASGFLFSAAGLSAGTHTLTVYAHTPNKGWWSLSRAITVAAVTATATATPTATPTGDSNVVIRILAPEEDDRVSGVGHIIKGWAIDTKSATGTGVDKVEVYLDGPRGESTKFLGAGDYGQSFGVPEQEYGNERFKYSGFDREWNPTEYSNGEHDIYVCAHSRHADVWKCEQVTIRIT